MENEGDLADRGLPDSRVCLSADVGCGRARHNSGGTAECNEMQKQCEVSAGSDKCVDSGGDASASWTNIETEHRKEESNRSSLPNGPKVCQATPSKTDSTSTSKTRRDSTTRPRETRASMLRAKSHPAAEATPQQRSELRRQNSVGGDKRTDRQSVGQKTTSSISRSTSSDDNSERDVLDLTSDKGLDFSAIDFKSKDQWMSAKPASQSSTMRPATAGQTPAANRPTSKTQSPGPSDLNQIKTKAMSHDCFSPYGPAEKYLTPLQQKDRQNREMNVQVAKLEQNVAEQDERIQSFEEEKQDALDELGQAKDTEMGKLLIEIKKLQMQRQQSEDSLTDVSNSLDLERNITASLREQITQMRKEQEDREAVHQKRYLDMYQKGREAQLIDQEEDLVCRAIASASEGDSQMRRLLKKLEETEQELDKLRQTFREDVYHKSPLLDTDSAAQVEVLKSAVYYFLTDTKPEVNLAVMLSLLHYSDVQKNNIGSHLKKKKSK